MAKADRNDDRGPSIDIASIAVNTPARLLMQRSGQYRCNENRRNRDVHRVIHRLGDGLQPVDYIGTSLLAGNES